MLVCSTLKVWLYVKCVLIGLGESCVAAGFPAYLQDERVEWERKEVRQERGEWMETNSKTREHMGWQDFKLGGRVGLTSVALVLSYNLAFWLTWNG